MKLSEERRDQAWVGAILEDRNAEGAFEELHAAYLPLIRSFFLNKGFAPDEVPDLVQELFLMVFKSLPTFRGKSSFRSWLFAVASHHCRDRWKSSKRAKRQGYEQSLDGPDHGLDETLRSQSPGPDELLVERERAEKLDMAIAQLPERARECARLRLQDYDVQEIATLLRIKAGTVKAHLYQARQRLAEILGEESSPWND